MRGVIADGRHALRLYWRTPGASLIAVVVLAVGMAFVGAFLSLYVDLVFQRHAGIEDSRRLVSIGQVDAARFTGIPLSLIERMREEVSALEIVSGVQSTSMTVGPEAERQPVELVTLGFFDGIRPRLALGRGFERADHDRDAAPVIVISDRYWREEFGADPAILGTTVDIIEEAMRRISIVAGRAQMEEIESSEDSVVEARIVGVMAPEMPGIVSDRIALWAPFERFATLSMGTANFQTIRSGLTLRTLGRLRPGTSAQGLARELRTRYPESTDDYFLQTGYQLDAIEGVVRDINVHRDSERQLRLFLAGSALLALVNRVLALRYFGREDVVGESLDIPSDAGPRTEIVGVLEDLSFVHPAAVVEPIVFMKLPPSPFGISSVIESPLPGAELQQELQGLIASGELDLGQPNVRPLMDLRANLIAPDTARSWLTIGTAGLVVLLAAFGFYGTQRYLVTAGRREYAIRAALGAGPKALGRLVLARGVILSLPGLVLGALLAFILVAWLREDFVSGETSPAAVTLGVVLGLTLLLLAASLGPARQARRTQPAPLLRED